MTQSRLAWMVVLGFLAVSLQQAAGQAWPQAHGAATDFGGTLWDKQTQLRTYQIVVGPANFQATGTQASDFYGATFPLGQGHEFTKWIVTANVKGQSYDSYSQAGGWYDSFSVSVTQGGSYWALQNQATPPLRDPIQTGGPIQVGFIGGGTTRVGNQGAAVNLNMANHEFATTDPTTQYYLNAILDTRTQPDADTNRPPPGSSRLPQPTSSISP